MKEIGEKITDATRYLDRHGKPVSAKQQATLKGMAGAMQAASKKK